MVLLPVLIFSELFVQKIQESMANSWLEIMNDPLTIPADGF